MKHFVDDLEKIGIFYSNAPEIVAAIESNEHQASNQ